MIERFLNIIFGKYWKGIKFNLPNFIISIGYCFSDVVINFETRYKSYTLRIIGFPKFHRTKNLQSIDPCLCEQRESEAQNG